MKNIVKYGYIILSLIFFVYLTIPNQSFPDKPDDALQSDEPADTESIERRAYFTNYDREGVIDNYVDQMKEVSILPTYRLNYPPEEAQTIIRDQTRSTFLEEVVHPFRESVFVNGFEPQSEKDAIFIQDKNWRQKIIVKQVQSNLLPRIIVGLLTILIIPFILRNIARTFSELGENIPRLWTYR